jgi:(E)-4-hydroxy-3-methylbut-2-enyl-diphosphate synthase
MLNSIRPWKNIYRRKSKKIFVGSVPIGGDSPISVQSMTNTLTTDVKATLEQINACVDAGADIMRVSCPDIESTRALQTICHESPVPIVADIHFHYKRAIEAAESGAACLRINPGNIGDVVKVKEVISAAKDHNCAIRIGVNAGSLERKLLEKYGEPCPDAMIESGIDHIRILEENDFFNFKISVKASDVFMAAAAYQGLAEVTEAPIHLGITEAGGRVSGTIKSAIGMGNLLWMGIGDTLRVSLSAEPVEEIKAGFEILKSLDAAIRGI